jgi:hypothetical protein
MNEKYQFNCALLWIEQNLSNVVTVERLGDTRALIGRYEVERDEFDGWCVYRHDEDDHASLLEDELEPVDAVCAALAGAVPNAMEAALSNPSTCPEQ